MNKIIAVVVCLMMSVWLCSCGKKAKNAAYGGAGDYYYGKSYYKPPKPHKAPKCDVPESDDIPESKSSAQNNSSDDIPEAKGSDTPQSKRRPCVWAGNDCEGPEEHNCCCNDNDGSPLHSCNCSTTSDGRVCGDADCQCCCSGDEGRYCCNCQTGEPN